MGYREEPDGTRVYDKGLRYRPVPLAERKYRKFPPGTKWFGGKPFEPKVFLPDEKREFPATISDEAAALHELGCLCHYCRTVERVRRLKRQRLGVRPRKDQHPIPE